MTKKAKRKPQEKDPTKMSTDEYAVWSKDKTDAEIIEHFPGMVLPPRPPIGESQDSVERKVLASLPEPPPAYASEREVLRWLQAVCDKGGSFAFALVFNKFFPFSALMRQQIWSSALKIRDDQMEAEKKEAQQKNAEIAKKAREAVAKGAEGWWDTRTA